MVDKEHLDGVGAVHRRSFGPDVGVTQRDRGDVANRAKSVDFRDACFLSVMRWQWRTIRKRDTLAFV